MLSKPSVSHVNLRPYNKAPTDADLAGFFKKLLTFDRFRSKVVPLGKGKSPGLGWASIADFDPMVGRCKLDPSLKAPGFKV